MPGDDPPRVVNRVKRNGRSDFPTLKSDRKTHWARGQPAKPGAANVTEYTHKSHTPPQSFKPDISDPTANSVGNRLTSLVKVDCPRDPSGPGSRLGA